MTAQTQLFRIGLKWSGKLVSSLNVTSQTCAFNTVLYAMFNVIKNKEHIIGYFFPFSISILLFSNLIVIVTIKLILNCN